MKSFFKIVLVHIMFCMSIKGYGLNKIKQSNKDVVFEITLDSLVKNKPYLIVYEPGYYTGKSAVAERKRIEPKQLKDNTYVFELKDQTRPAYFSLMIAPYKLYFPGMKDNIIIKEYFFEPGDHVMIAAKPSEMPTKYDVIFSGKGSAKYSCQNDFGYVMSKDSVKHVYEFSGEDVYNPNNTTTRSLEVMLQLTNKYQPRMTSYAYNLINADFIGKLGYELLLIVNSKLVESILKKDTAKYKKLVTDFSSKFKYDYADNIPLDILINSKEYAGFLIEKIRGEYLMKYGKHSYPGYYESIKMISNIALRDKMIGIFFKRYWVVMNEGYDVMIDDALKTVEDEEIRTVLKSYNRLREGEKGFNFSLTDINGRRVSLNDFKGKVVFMDFWFTGCTFCKGYYESVLAEVESKYKKNSNIVFITVSIDKDKDRWLESVNSGKYTSKLAVNLYTNGEGNQNEIIKYYNINSYPRPVVFDRNGRIVKFTGNELRNKEKLIQVLESSLNNYK